MSEFDDRLSGILSSPEAMEKIRALAETLSGDGGSRSSAEDESPPELDPELMGMITRILGEYRSYNGGKAAVLRSIAPYLEPERQKKLRRAFEIAKLAHAARSAFSGSGNKDGNVQ